MKAIFRLLKKFPVHLFAVALILVIVASNLASVQAQSNFQKIRGVWITNNDTTRFMDQAKLQESVNFLSQLNFNTLYPVIWNSGYVLYESAIAQQEGIQPFSPRGYQGQDVLADLIDKSHQKGMLVVPWFEFGFMAPTTSELVTRHPQWVTQRQDGSKTWVGGVGEVVWLNPFHPQVQKFVTDLIMEMVNKYDLDGVQFDDHMCLPNDFGYDPYTISLYTKETKKAPPSNPRDPAWVRWRANKITAFMTELHKAVKAQKPNILFSVSPATYNLAYNTYLQDWLDWVRKGIVDEVVVQVYRSELPHFLEPLSRPEFQEAKAKVPTAVGILTGLKTKPIPMPLIDAKVRAAEAQGLGVAFFYYKTLWDIAPESTQERKTYFQAMFSSSPAPRSLAQRVNPPVQVATPQVVNPTVPTSSVAPNHSGGDVSIPVNSFQDGFQDNFPPEPTL